MILCDGVAIDQFTGKATILGVTGGFRVAQVPEVLPPFAVYIVFSDVTRKVRLDIQIVTLDEEVIHAYPPTMVEASEPLASIEFDARFTDVSIPTTDDYFVRLLADGVYMMDLRFNVALDDGEE
jgi:hypothetical protein